MARTKTPRNALAVVKQLPELSRLQDDGFALFVANEALKWMWREYDWRESLKELPPLYMTPNEPDFSTLLNPLPTDFWYLREAWIRGVGGETFDLNIVADLPISSRTGRPTSIGPAHQKDTLRLFPTPAEGWGAPFYQVEGSYKATPTLYDATTLSSALPFDDQYFDCYLAALRYKYFDTIGSPRAGGTEIQGGAVRYTGELATYKRLRAEAVGHEVATRGSQFIAPSDGLLM